MSGAPNNWKEDGSVAPEAVRVLLLVVPELLFVQRAARLNNVAQDLDLLWKL